MITPTFFFFKCIHFFIHTVFVLQYTIHNTPEGILRSGQDVGGRPGHYFHLLSCTDH